MGGQVTEKAIDLALAHVFRMGLAAVEFDESENPVAVGLLRTVGIVVISKSLFWNSSMTAPIAGASIGSY